MWNFFAKCRGNRYAVVPSDIIPIGINMTKKEECKGSK